MRLAHRIATNRTIAGVHFPTDSMAGAFLGISIGEFLVAKMSRSPDPVKSRTYDAQHKNEDFTLVTLEAELTGAQNGMAGNVAAGGGPEDELLREIWAAAQSEW
jgi:hypothetical protein